MCDALSKHGNNVTLLCTSSSNKFKINNYISCFGNIVESPDLLYGKLRQGIDLWNIFQRYKILAQHKFDIIHAIDCRPVVILPSLFLKRKLRIPLILSWWDFQGKGGTTYERYGKLYGYSIGLLESFFDVYFRRQADAAIVLTKFLKNFLIKHNYPESKIRLIRVGTNLRKINSKKSVLRQVLQLPESKTIFCYAGALFNKDKSLLIDSLRLLKERIGIQPLTILIGNHKVDKHTCQELAILVTGYLKESEDVDKYLFASDWGLLPMKMSIANRARWPSKVGDYWATGLPVITTPISDFKDIFSKNELGYICEDDSPENLCAIMFEAINVDNERKAKMSSNSIKYIERELDWNILAKKQISVYKSCILNK